MFKVMNRRFVRMIDHDGFPILSSFGNRFLERAVDGLKRNDVVEKDVLARRRYQVGLCDIQRDPGGGCPAVQEVEISLLDDSHQSLHGGWRTGQQAAGVIADSRQVRQPIKRGFKGAIEFRGTH